MQGRLTLRIKIKIMDWSLILMDNFKNKELQFPCILDKSVQTMNAKYSQICLTTLKEPFWVHDIIQIQLLNIDDSSDQYLSVDYIPFRCVFMLIKHMMKLSGSFCTASLILKWRRSEASPGGEKKLKHRTARLF